MGGWGELNPEVQLPETTSTGQGAGNLFSPLQPCLASPVVCFSPVVERAHAFQVSVAMVTVGLQIIFMGSLNFYSGGWIMLVVPM